MSSVRLRLIAAALCPAFLLAGAAAAPAATRPRITIKVLSGRPDLVSGGSALVAIGGITSTAGLKVTAAGADHSTAFGIGPDGRGEGLVDGLRLGGNTVIARTPRGAAKLTLTNHPIGGPVLSGPQIQPWTCQDGAADKQCNAKSVIAYQYMPQVAGSFQDYDPENPPPDSQIAKTTTDTGETVPFIVRKETGYLDRDQYAIATLWQPAKPWTPVSPQPQFNRRLVLTHGASCDTTYGSGDAPDVMNSKLLAHGFVVASHALDNAGHNCNLVPQAES